MIRLYGCNSPWLCTVKDDYKKLLEETNRYVETHYYNNAEFEQERNAFINEVEKNRKLKQTLTEIKDFFKEECLICKENYINITGEICKECKYQDILKKINEV